MAIYPLWYRIHIQIIANVPIYTAMMNDTPGSVTTRPVLDDGYHERHPLSHGKYCAIDWKDKVVV